MYWFLSCKLYHGYFPREIIALFRVGDSGATPFGFVSPAMPALSAVPLGIKVRDILYALKRMAMEKDMFPKKFPVYVLSKSFVSVTSLFGKSYELGLLLICYLKTNPLKLIAILPFAYRLWCKGPISWGYLKGLKRENNFQKS